MAGWAGLRAPFGGAPQAVLAEGDQKHQLIQGRHQAGCLHRRGDFPRIGAPQQKQHQVGKGVADGEHHGKDAGDKRPLGSALLIHPGKELAQVKLAQQQEHPAQHGEEVLHHGRGLGVKHIDQDEAAYPPQHTRQIEQGRFPQAVAPLEKAQGDKHLCEAEQSTAC